MVAISFLVFLHKKLEVCEHDVLALLGYKEGLQCDVM